MNCVFLCSCIGHAFLKLLEVNSMPSSLLMIMKIFLQMSTIMFNKVDAHLEKIVAVFIVVNEDDYIANFQQLPALPR